MNFLAHFHLAGPSEGLIVGGLEGDYCKGPLRGNLPDDIEAGIRLHRNIDAFTDSHPIITQLRRQFPRQLRRYAGILIDLSFDHCLSRHWSRYADMELATFNREIYRILAAREAELSAGGRNMAQRIRQYDILSRYHDWDSIPASAARVGQRFAPNPLQDVRGELFSLREDLNSAFLAFYPELLEFARQWQSQSANADAITGADSTRKLCNHNTRKPIPC